MGSRKGTASGSLFLVWMNNWRYAQQPVQRHDAAPRHHARALAARTQAASPAIAVISSVPRVSVNLPAQSVRAKLDLTGELKAKAAAWSWTSRFDRAAADSTAVTFSNAVGESRVFRINRAQHRYELDRSRSGTVGLHPQSADIQSAPLRARS